MGIYTLFSLIFAVFRNYLTMIFRVASPTMMKYIPDGHAEITV